MRNLWSRFATLLPTRRRFVGAVVAHNADGTSTITTSAGGTFRARGQLVGIGQQAEVEDGAVVRQAPSLTTVAIDV